jgi:hypothetical protein
MHYQESPHSENTAFMDQLAHPCSLIWIYTVHFLIYQAVSDQIHKVVSGQLANSVNPNQKAGCVG